ncbi:hypothetical protein DFJ73DRAFT_768071 [Zopfochytrium polystomum]|nr:hypothetical protein DFJ73DRAFT_768071 [Zopfochytrium polystomum]
MCDYEYVKGAKKGTLCGVKSRDGKEKCSKHRKEGKGEEKKVVRVKEMMVVKKEEKMVMKFPMEIVGMIMRYVGEVKGSIDEKLKWERETGIKLERGRVEVNEEVMKRREMCETWEKKGGIMISLTVKCEKCKRSKRLMVECPEYNKRMDVIRMEGEEEYEREYKLMAWTGLGWGPKREEGDEANEWKKREKIECKRKPIALQPAVLPGKSWRGKKLNFRPAKEKRKMNSIKKGKNKGKGQSEIEIDERFSSPIGWIDLTEVPLGKIINHYQTVLDDDDDPVWRLMKGLSEEVLKKKLGDPGKETLGSENETYQVTYDKKTGKHKWEYRGICIYENSRIYPGPMTKEEIWRWRSRYE